MRTRPIVLSILLTVLLGSVVQAQTPDDHFSRTFPLQAGSTARVKNYKGLIRIEAADSNQATVDVKKIWDGRSDNLRDEWLKELQVTINAEPKRLEAIIEYPSHSCFFNCSDEWGGHVELVMRVPRNSNLDIDGYKPELAIDGIEGNIRVHSYKSPIKIRNTTGAIEVDTYKDTIVLEDVNLKGRLRIHDYKADTEVRARSLSDGADLESSRGSIRLHLPPDSHFNVDISGERRADIRSDFTAHVEAGGSRRITGEVNGGGPEVRIRTSRGSVALLKDGNSGL